VGEPLDDDDDDNSLDAANPYKSTQYGKSVWINFPLIIVKEIRQRLGIDDIISVLQQNRLHWYGHALATMWLWPFDLWVLQSHCHSISVPGLVLIAQAVFLLEHGHTHRHTHDMQSHRRHWSLYPRLGYRQHGWLLITLHTYRRSTITADKVMWC